LEFYLFSQRKMAIPLPPFLNTKAQAATIPVSTILPVVLRTAFSFDNCKPGTDLEGEDRSRRILTERLKIQKRFDDRLVVTRCTGRKAW
jgi:hypothetical protein